ncbi:MAG: hypothetical protein ABIF12_00400 [bacterium]
MKKNILFFITTLIIYTNSSSMTLSPKQEEIISQRIANLRSIDKKSLKELKESLTKSYSNISSPKDKQIVTNLLRELKSPEEYDHEIRKIKAETISTAIKNVTSPFAIGSVASIVVLMQIKGIITSEELTNILKEIKSILKWEILRESVFSVGTILSAFLPKFL